MDNRRSVLWDMDGVLVDSGELHYLCWDETLTEAGIYFDHELFRRTLGMNDLPAYGMPDRPNRAVFLEAARRLETSAGRCVVVDPELNHQLSRQLHDD